MTACEDAAGATNPLQFELPDKAERGISSYLHPTFATRRPGLRPVGVAHTSAGSPLLAYEWAVTNRALADQLALEKEGYAGTVEPGHAAVRFTNPVDGADVLPTIRAEFHRVIRGAETAPVRETGSSVYQVFDGSGTVTVGDTSWSVTRGGLFVVPSWEPFSAKSEAGATDSDSGGLDLFRFSDAPSSRRSASTGPARTPDEARHHPYPAGHPGREARR